MIYIFNFAEKIFRYIKIKLKCFFWKIKYGKRIKIGKNINFRKNLIINISPNGYLEIGDNCFFNNYCSINCHEKVIIGDNNLFGENVKIYDHNHIFNDKRINMKKSFKNNPILIGNNNWFGSNVVILPNSKINDNSVVGCSTIINDIYSSDALIKSNCPIKVKNIVYVGDNDD